jgi:hypothetical protein
MAQGLLGGVLPAIYSGADQLKRGVYGLLTNPMEQAERAGQSLLQSRADRQALMARTFGNPERPFQVTDQAGLAQLGDQVMSGELGFAPAGITAFHGSPYKFNKFDMSKVGTGEGAQSYGYGMYFAENPAVAKQYQAALSDTKYFADGKQLKGDDAWAAQFLHDFQYDALPKKVDVNTAVAKANEILKAGEAREQIVSKIKQLDKTGVSVESGSLYKVDIPDEQIPKMLDWDKPFKEQSKDVQSVLKEINPNISENDVGRVIYESFARPSKMSENSPMIEFMRNNAELTPQAAASKFLNEKGIKGIRYLDEGSRIAPKYTGDPAFIYAGNDFKQNGYTLEEAFEGMKQAYKNEDFKEIKDALGEVYGVKPNQTSNFVVFEPTDVKMLERNNQPVEGLLGN